MTKAQKELKRKRFHKKWRYEQLKAKLKRNNPNWTDNGYKGL